MASNKKYKCPFCKLHDTKEKLIYHIDKKHEDMIPEGFTAARILFHYIHKKPISEKGRCVICHNDTNWNEKTYKYNRLCDRRECKEKLRENYKKNMLRVFGTYNILNDMNQQEKMLKNRSISGIYKFRNGKIKDYVGSYERKFLEFCDLMLGFDPDDIMMPGPTIEYEYKGQKHVWITDALIVPYNLVLDIKDGGSNPNNREMNSYREKQIEKEKVITNKGEYNYLRLTDNQFPQLIAIIYELKLQMLDDPDTTKTISRVHESYDPPMNEKQIREKYPDKADILLKDPVHKWRAEKGIELIHKEPSKKELDRIWNNWNKMSDDQKKESDDYSKKLFGKTNKDNYEELSKSYNESTEEENNPELVNNPKDLNKVLNKFDYGVISVKTGKKVDQKFYRSLSPLEFLKYKCGICWDFCAYQDKWFKNHNIKYSLYFVSAKTSTYKTHTFLIYQDKETKKFCIFESSWGKMQGIHEYNSEKEAMMDYFNKFKDDLPDKNKSTNKYLLMKYKQPLKYHLSANDYLNYIYNNGIIIINEGNIFNEDLKTKLDIIEVEVNSMNNIKSISETVKLPEIKPKDIQFIKALDGTNNAYIVYKGDNYRVRVETLIVNDKGEVYIDKSNKYTKYGIQYRIPGGSVEPDRDFVTQAENECKEEVHINIKNAYYSGQNWVMLFPPNSNSGIPNFSYKGCISYIYVAEYNGKYHGYVKVADRDDMYKTGKFYKYKDVKWLPAHKKALEDYFKSHKVLKESGDTMNDVIKTGKDQEYYKYLKIHEVRLKASFNDRIYALKNALLLSKEQCEELKERILKHDASRYTPEEWDDWRKSYFPINDKEKEEGEESEKKARDHHYKVNAHHPEHWKGKEMDKVSIAEMIIDWEADSKADGGNPLKWWLYNDEAKEKKKLLNPKTREEVERVLQTIYDVDMNLKDNFDRINDPKKAE